METREYTNPQDAYNLMNQWTTIQTSYETEFQGKQVTRVDILFKGDQPRFASVHYKTGSHIGCDSIDLSKKILLDKPHKPSLEFKLVNQN